MVFIIFSFINSLWIGMSSFSANTEELSLFYHQWLHRRTESTDTDTADTVNSLIQSVAVYTGYIYRCLLQYWYSLTTPTVSKHWSHWYRCPVERWGNEFAKVRAFYGFIHIHQGIVVRWARLSFPKIRCTQATYNFEN
jgi:hypothetical protein